MNTPRLRGSIMLLVIVFGGIFFTLLVALSGFVLAQNRLQDVTLHRAEAFDIAEAGLEHYRWYLSHFPGDTQDGTGHAGPYTTSYPDPQGGTAGTYTLSIVGNSACGVVQSIDVTSTGAPTDGPGTSSTIWARYAEPSVARYNMILNAGVWWGGGPLYGPLHSNNGIRMDGSPNAPVTSSVSTWSCDSSFNCNPAQTVPGVFGNGTNQNLWDYPTPQVDFSAIAASFSSLKTVAQTSGLYFPRISTSKNPHLGYHLIFNGNGTVTVNKVTAVATNLSSYPADGSAQGFTRDYSLISSETALGTYSIPTNCGVIFVEDNVWLEGSVSTKATVVAADVADQGIYPNIVVPNNIIYTAFDGTAGLTAIASHDVLIGPNSPANLTMDGIFVAQSGVFGRNWYACNTNYAYRSDLNQFGTVVSTLRPVTAWLVGGTCPGGVSGYSGGTSVFDRQNSTNPPPFTPVTSSQWQFVDWKQQ
ncbi:MAG TPA: hypothetical protein VMV62_01165 [Candidatus Paceibacterota bacterium]|nr:hypothetical protein [Candidatus Paceibacterota bacterium]